MYPLLPRRSILGILGLVGLARSAGAAASDIETFEIPLGVDDSLPMMRWPSRVPGSRSTLMLLHGLGGSPQGYAGLVDALVAGGHEVLAPLHLDSLRHPRHRALSPQGGDVGLHAKTDAPR